MKTSTIKGALGVLALLTSSVGTAATMTVTPSSSQIDTLGTMFTVLLQGSAFTNNVGGITLDLTFNPSVVSYVSSVLPAAGPLAPATGTILQINDTNPTPTAGVKIINILPGSSIPTGAFDIATFTFQTVGNGLANIVFNDDGGLASGFFDNDTADYIPVNYAQANVNVGVVPAPATLGLLASGLAGLVVRSSRRRRAAA